MAGLAGPESLVVMVTRHLQKHGSEQPDKLAEKGWITGTAPDWDCDLSEPMQRQNSETIATDNRVAVLMGIPFQIRIPLGQAALNTQRTRLRRKWIRLFRNAESGDHNVPMPLKVHRLHPSRRSPLKNSCRNFWYSGPFQISSKDCSRMLPILR